LIGGLAGRGSAVGVVWEFGGQVEVVRDTLEDLIAWVLMRTPLHFADDEPFYPNIPIELPPIFAPTPILFKLR